MHTEETPSVWLQSIVWYTNCSIPSIDHYQAISQFCFNNDYVHPQSICNDAKSSSNKKYPAIDCYLNRGRLMTQIENEKQNIHKIRSRS